MGLPPLAHESLTGATGRFRAAARPSVWTGGLLAVATAVAGAGLVLVYDRLSATAPLTADSANAVLQGRSMAEGNVLLTGWTLSGASFYATDLPLYAAVAAFRGLSPNVAHDVGAVIYTLLVLVACFLAAGRARGPVAVRRMVVTLLLLVAPAPGEAVQLILLGPFHAGTTLVLVLALLVIDRSGERVVGAVVAGALLSLALLSDALAFYVGALPIAGVALLRLATGRRRRRSDGALLAASALSVPVSLALGAVLAWLGGFATLPLHASFARIEDMPTNAALTVEGGLLLFGANFFGQPVALPAILAILAHLAGFAFVLLSCRWAVLAWRRVEEPDRVSQVLMAGMVLDVAAYLFSNQAIDLMTSRYLIPFLVFGAVLAGRVGADRLWSRAWLRACAAVVGVVYVAFLGISLRTPPAVEPEAEVGAYLARQHLTYGVAAYWQASTVTVISGGRVRVRAVAAGPSLPGPYLWEAQRSWYDPRLPGNDARFALRDTWDPRSVDPRVIEATFGPPAQHLRFGRYEVFVWDHNLLDNMAH
jgi:hypothetical protein